MAPQPVDDGRQQPGEDQESDAVFMIVDDRGAVVRVTGWERAFGVPAPERIEAPGAQRDRLLACLVEAIDEAGTTGGLARRTADLDDPPQKIDVAAASLAIGGGGASTAIIVQPRGAAGGGRPGGEGKTIRKLEHDLRSPLTSISGAAELLESGRLGAVNAQQTKCLGVVQKGVDAMLGLLESAAAPYRLAHPLRNSGPAPDHDDGEAERSR